MSEKYGTYVKIENWKKYNPRGDVKQSSWFRLEHALLVHPDWKHFSAAEILIWVALLSNASFVNRGWFRFDAASVALAARAKPEELESAIAKLLEMQCIAFSDTQPSDEDVTEPSRERSPTRRDDTLRKEGEEEALVEDPPEIKLAEIWNDAAEASVARIDAIADKALRDRLHALPSVDLQAFRKNAKAGRRRAAAARLKTHPDLEHWRKVAERIAASNFCLGDSDRGWVADFDFFVQPEAHVKVLEGKYDNRKSAPRGGSGRSALVDRIVAAVSKYRSGASMTPAEYELHRKGVRDAIGEDAWRIVAAVGGWDKVHQAAARGEFELRQRLREVSP